MTTERWVKWLKRQAQRFRTLALMADPKEIRRLASVVSALGLLIRAVVKLFAAINLLPVDLHTVRDQIQLWRG